MRRTPPERGENGLQRTSGLSGGTGKPKRSTARTRAATRRDKLFRRQFHSPAFVEWIHTQPCVRCEALGFEQVTESEPHHEPPRARSNWKHVSPLCQSCHTSGPGARHGPNSGVDSFWTFGITYEQANGMTHMRWLGHIDRR